MIKTNAGKIAFVVALAFASTGAFAKLPPPSEEAKVKAEEAKVKAAETAKVEGELLAKSQDRVAEKYIKEQKAKGITVKPTPIVAPPPPPAVAAAPAAPAAAAVPAAVAPAPAAAPKK